VKFVSHTFIYSNSNTEDFCFSDIFSFPDTHAVIRVYHNFGMHSYVQAVLCQESYTNAMILLCLDPGTVAECKQYIHTCRFKRHYTFLFLEKIKLKPYAGNYIIHVREKKL